MKVNTFSNSKKFIFLNEANFKEFKHFKEFKYFY